MGELDNNNTDYPNHTKQGGDLVPYFWCEENGIDIRPMYHYKNGTHEWRITITIGNKRNVDPKVYDKKDIMEQMYKYSDYYLDKYCTNKPALNKLAKKITKDAAIWRGNN